MRRVLGLILQLLSLQRIASNPHIAPETYTCYHRPGVVGSLLEKRCRILQKLGLARNACIEIATFDRLRLFKAIPSGTTLKNLSVSKVPVVLIDTRSLPDSQMSKLTEKIASAQRKGAYFRPVFILGTTNFKPFRKYEYMLEYIPHKNAWVKAKTNQLYENYTAKRISSLLINYAPDRTVHIDSDNITHLKPETWTKKNS